MIPSGGIVTNEEITEVEQPSLTWKLDTEKGRILSRVDGLEAVEQAAAKILQTPRYQYLIYTPNYGSELNELIGMDPILVKSEVNRMLQEALTQDDRISGIEDVQITIDGDGLLVEFTVVTEYGSFEMSREVNM